MEATEKIENAVKAALNSMDYTGYTIYAEETHLGSIKVEALVDPKKRMQRHG